MAPKASRASGAPAPEDAETFLARLDHPFKREILALRRIILDADPRISEGVKWNAPSFRTSEWFATVHLREPGGVRVILHFGAKKRDAPARGAAIADPESLLEWLGHDRASVTFRGLDDVGARGAAFAAVVRQWIEHVAP